MATILFLDNFDSFTYNLVDWDIRFTFTAMIAI